MILGGQAQVAFDIDKEDPKAADRYGQGPWAAYRSWPAGWWKRASLFVTVDMPHWDDHSKIKDGHGYKLGPLDRAVGA